MATLLIMALKDESQMLFENNKILPFYCGVGQVKAAFITHKLILEHKPKRIVNLGTAGSFTIKQGSLVECTSFIQRAPADTIAAPSKAIRFEAMTDLPHVKCGTGDFIEKNPLNAKCDIMDMEAYAMAHVCQQLNVDFTSIKYISDSSDANLLPDWKSHLSSSAQKLFEQYQKLLMLHSLRQVQHENNN